MRVDTVYGVFDKTAWLPFDFYPDPKGDPLMQWVMFRREEQISDVYLLGSRRTVLTANSAIVPVTLPADRRCAPMAGQPTPLLTSPDAL